jgi:hypothetical protein
MLSSHLRLSVPSDILSAFPISLIHFSSSVCAVMRQLQITAVNTTTSCRHESQYRVTSVGNLLHHWFSSHSTFRVSYSDICYCKLYFRENPLHLSQVLVYCSILWLRQCGHGSHTPVNVSNSFGPNWKLNFWVWNQWWSENWWCFQR